MLHSGSARRCGLFAYALLLGALTLAATALHIRLDASVPAADAALTEPPDELRLRFSGLIEERYTRVTVTAPDGRLVPTGAITFVAGSDREFTAALPRLAASGRYVVNWRTAGADGHVLEGSWAFTLRLAVEDSAALDTAGLTPGPGAVEPHGHDEHQDAATSSSSMSPAMIIGRSAHFAALTLLLGAFAFRVLVLPRASLPSATMIALRRDVWRVAAFAALALILTAAFRLWLQSRALHGADRAGDPTLLSIMLTGTGWGRAWILQLLLLALLAVPLAAARTAGDRVALAIAVPAVLGLAVIPALSGHAAGIGIAAPAVLNDTVHVVAAGAWVGSLAVLAYVARRRTTGGTDAPAEGRLDSGRVADLVDVFSPAALAAAAVLSATGVINGLMHFQTPVQLVDTAYGRALLVKLALVGLVIGAGAFNWRVVRPALRGAEGATRLRRSLAVEVAFAAAVLLATGWLTGLPRP